MAIVLDKTKDGYVEYDAIFVDPQSLAVLNNDIAMNILKEMNMQPMCAMDLARKLDQHEQKVYYHLNKLQKSGLIQLVGTEKRYGMVAQLYDLVSPVVAAKLHENGKVINTKGVKDANLEKLLEPFVNLGKLNGFIVIGDPYPHGKFDMGGLDACYATDIAFFLGNVVGDIKFPCYKFDIRMNEKELHDNMILVGSPKTNSIVEKLNDKLPLYFDPNNNNTITSKKTGTKYDDDMVGLIVKMPNPYDSTKTILVIGGRRTRGTMAATIAFTQKFNEIMKMEHDGVLSVVVRGLDKDGDGVIDDVKILE